MDDIKKFNEAETKASDTSASLSNTSQVYRGPAEVEESANIMNKRPHDSPLDTAPSSKRTKSQGLSEDQDISSSQNQLSKSEKATVGVSLDAVRSQDAKMAGPKDSSAQTLLVEEELNGQEEQLTSTLGSKLAKESTDSEEGPKTGERAEQQGAETRARESVPGQQVPTDVAVAKALRARRRRKPLGRRPRSFQYKSEEFVFNSDSEGGA